MSWINWEKERKALKGVVFGAIAGALLLGIVYSLMWFGAPVWVSLLPLGAAHPIIYCIKETLKDSPPKS